MTNEFSSFFPILKDLIKKRRSIRIYEDEIPNDDDILSILEMGIWAPSGSNMHARCFIIVKKKDILKKLKAFSPGIIGEPPVLIILCSDKKKALEVCGELGEKLISILDVALSAQNIMLSAWALGLGTCPISSFNPKAIAKILNLPDHIYPELIISLGYPKIIPPPPKRPNLEEVVFYEEFRSRELKK